MQLDEFKASLSLDQPPPALSAALKALWWDAREQWEKAHAFAQADEDADAAWVHAYLHRKEGDRDNAVYWYRRAGRPEETANLDAEWLSIVEILLSSGERGGKAG